MAADQLQLSELFYSIQGESSFAGYPCVFIRLSGCNLRCRYCDSAYSYNEPGRNTPMDEILEFAAGHPHALIEITGGEPLLQSASLPLMTRLVESGRTVLLETNGSLALDDVPSEVIKIVDLKCPDSGMHQHMLFTNLTTLNPQDEIKCVISSRRDYDWAVRTLRELMILGQGDKQGARDGRHVLFSPVSGQITAQALGQWILQDELPVRLQIQLHKILWPGTSRGV